MPSSFSFLLNSQSSSSSSSLENDLKSDQSDDDDDDDDIGSFKERTIQNDNDMLERPSDDDDDSCSQTDDSDSDEKENDLFTSSNNPRSYFLTRQLTIYDNDWPKKSSIDESIFKRSINRDDSTILEIERNDTSFLNSNQRRLFSPEQNKSVGIVDKKQHQSRNMHTLSLSDSTTSTQERHSISEQDNMQTVSSLSQTKTSTISSPKRTSTTNEETKRPISKIPIRTNSSSQSRSRSPAVKTTINRRIQSPTNSSKIPVPVSTNSKGAFRFFTPDDRPLSSSSSQLFPITDSTQISNQTTKQISPFTPITHSKKPCSSAGNTPSAKHRRIILPSSDDDDSETNNLKEADLKLKLKEQKRHGKKTGELLNKLHENYEELLEKYAQAENTIDQLRFQPKILGDNTPPSNAAEGTIHFIQQLQANIATLRSNDIYHTTSDTPYSSIRQMPSTTTTPAVKSTSPANSGTIESIFFDESIPQKIIVQELTTPETIKLDLLIQTKTLGDKMKSFLTLMDANQLSLAEQKQVYETIKEDYEKLLKSLDRTKRGSDLSDIDLDTDLNKELEGMKQLLKEIVKRITDNLLGKSSSSSSEVGRSHHLTRDGSRSSTLSARSSLCNHADLMDQYQKLLNAVNTEVVEKTNEINPLHTGLEQIKKTTSRDSSQSNISGHLPSTARSQKVYVYASGNSDYEQQQNNDLTPISSTKHIQSTSFTLDHIPSIKTKYHQQINEEQPHIHGIAKITKKKKFPNQQEMQEYDNLDNVPKTKRKIKIEEKKISNYYHPDKEFSPSSFSIPTGNAQYSGGSLRTRTSDYDSGIGTNNTTKLSRDRLNTSTMDESHYQLLDEERRRHSDQEQEFMSSVSSSRSSGSGAATSPKNLSSKYKNRFNSSSSLKQLNENSRRKPSGHSDTYQSDIETHITGSFDPLPQPLLYSKKSRPIHISNRSRLTPFHRSISTGSIQIDNYKNNLNRPQTVPEISSKTSNYYKMGRKYQSGFIHQHTTASSTYPKATYKSSFYIDQAHTHRRSQEKLHQNQRKLDEQIQPSNKTNLYLDPQTGTIYRHIPNKTQTSMRTSYQSNSQIKPSKDLYQCSHCRCITTYQHHHHIKPNIKRITTDIDDPGYESGNRKMDHHRRYAEHLTSSDSEQDENSTYLDMSILNEAYERAKKVQNRSQNLSKHISRQLKLVLSTI